MRVSAEFGRVAQWRNPSAATVRDSFVRLLPVSTYLRMSDDTLGWTPAPRLRRYEEIEQ